MLGRGFVYFVNWNVLGVVGLNFVLNDVQYEFVDEVFRHYIFVFVPVSKVLVNQCLMCMW